MQFLLFPAFFNASKKILASSTAGGSFLLLLLSCAILCLYSLITLRSFALLNSSFSPLLHSLDHVFFLKAFFYPRTNTISNQSRANVVFTLFNAEKRSNPKSLQPECLFKLPEGRIWRQNAILEEIYPGYTDFPCQISTYRLICHSLPLIKPIDPKFPVKLSIQMRKSPLFELPLVMAERRPRGLVVCPGRAFAFEQWHLFITAMELNRLQGIELVVAHVLSVQESVFGLFELYQNYGFLRIRPSLRMLTVSTLPYVPNSENLWSNIIVDFLDCLYEFRESAQFISFPDWDDLLLAGTSIPTRYSSPILPILRKLANNYAVFMPKRYPGHIIRLDQMHARNMTLFQIWKDGLRFSLKPNDVSHISKIILRPSMVSSVELHGAYKLDWEVYDEMEVQPDQLLFVHARDYDQHIDRDSLGASTAIRLNSSFRRFLSLRRLSPDSSPLFRSLPRRELFRSTLLECAARIKTFVELSKHSKCFNLNRCWDFLPPIFELLSEEQGNLCFNVIIFNFIEILSSSSISNGNP